MTPAQAIRLAMMGGILLFGGTSWFLTHTPDWVAPAPEFTAQLTAVARIIWIVVSTGLLVMFLKFRNQEDLARASTVAIIAWSLGETLGLLGAVVLFLTSITTWFIAGVIALALTFVAFPAPLHR